MLVRSLAKMTKYDVDVAEERERKVTSQRERQRRMLRVKGVDEKVHEWSPQEVRAALLILSS